MEFVVGDCLRFYYEFRNPFVLIFHLSVRKKDANTLNNINAFRYYPEYITNINFQISLFL